MPQNETELYEDEIYRLLTTDPVVGYDAANPGAGEGISNTPLRQLASRTAWLRARAGIAGTWDLGTEVLPSGAGFGKRYHVTGAGTRGSITAQVGDVVEFYDANDLTVGLVYKSPENIEASINAAVTGLLDDRGNYDASSNLFPSSGGSGTAGAVMKGDIWRVSVAGTLGGTAVSEGDWVRALADAPGQTASNWAINAADNAVAAHVAATDPHGDRSYADSAIAAAVAGHVAATDPHPQYNNVFQYANLAAFPAIGTEGAIYIAEDMNKLYRWNGAAYATVGDGGPVAQVDATVGGTVVIGAGTTSLDFTGAYSSTKTIDCTNIANGATVAIHSINDIGTVTLSGTGLTFTGSLTPFYAGQVGTLTRNGNVVHATATESVANKVQEIESVVPDFFAGQVQYPSLLATRTAVNTCLAVGDVLDQFILSGLDLTMTGGLNTTISAGVAYIGGEDNGAGSFIPVGRIVRTEDNLRTHPTFRDIYVDLTNLGYGVSQLNYTTTSNGNPPPPQAKASLRLWKIVTNGTEVTSIERLAPTQPTFKTRITVPDAVVAGDAVNKGQLDAAVAGHVAATDPHPQYTTEQEAADAAPVQSVNGQTGDVSLDAADVGADPAGTADGVVSAHVAATDPHGDRSYTDNAVAALSGTVADFAGLPSAADNAGRERYVTAARCWFRSNGTDWVQTSVGSFTAAEQAALTPADFPEGFLLRRSDGEKAGIYVRDGAAFVAVALTPKQNIFIDVFSVSGTWTKRDGVQMVEGFLLGGGGGGGSGRRSAAGTRAYGGGGGGGGSRTHFKCPASAFDATETVTIGAGGVGGAAQTGIANGNAGASGGATIFGALSKFRANGGGGGFGGTTSSGSAGSATDGWPVISADNSGGAGGAGNFTNAATVSSVVTAGNGGAGGGGVNNDVNNTAGNGGTILAKIIGSGPAVSLPINYGGAASGGNGQNGGNTPSWALLIAVGAQGGSGGAGSTVASGLNGGTGGNGGYPAGGGGGGGGVQVASAQSGAGGNGGNGYAVIVSYR